MNKYKKIILIIGIFILLLISSILLLSFNNISKSKEKVTKNNNYNKYIEQIIKDYSLNRFKDDIYSNEDFFLDYADIVLKNENIKEYKKYVFDLFEIIIDNKNNLDKSYFLKNLSKLSIEGVDEYDYVAEGVYLNDEKKIQLLNNNLNTKIVLYHELLHFLDDSMKAPSIEYFYVCNDYYTLDENEFDPEAFCSYYKGEYIHLFLEGGADRNSVKYFGEGINTTWQYAQYVNIYNILSYIFGEDKINNVYYSPNTLFEFYKLLCLENGLDNTEFNNLMLILEGEEEFFEADILIDLYYLKNDEEWYLNKTFKNMIQSLLVYYDTNESDYYDSKYYYDFEEYIDNKNVSNIIDEYINVLNSKDERLLNTDSSIENSMFTIINNKVYYVHYMEFSNYPARTYLIDFDFDTKKVINHKVYDY